MLLLVEYPNWSNHPKLKEERGSVAVKKASGNPIKFSMCLVHLEKIQQISFATSTVNLKYNKVETFSVGLLSSRKAKKQFLFRKSIKESGGSTEIGHHLL